jgi:hypothetical protein
MAPGKVSKMKQVCAASPGKFASALLDILDGSVEGDCASPLAEASPEKVSTIRKRPAAAMRDDKAEPPAKRKRLSKVTGQEEMPAKRISGAAQKVKDQNLAAQLRKELKVLKLARIKDMVVRKGLELGSKEKMIESIITLEAKGRENIRRHKANFRDVLGKKREEFSGKKNKELKELLQAYALQTGGTKPERVERLLATWQEQGEIEKVLAGMAFQVRKVELNAMDKHALYELCRKKGVDALSKEVLVERLLVHESVEIWQEVVEARSQIS